MIAVVCEVVIIFFETHLVPEAFLGASLVSRRHQKGWIQGHSH